MNTQNILNALRNISLVWTLTPDEFDLYHAILCIYIKVREYKNERNYKDEEIVFSYTTIITDTAAIGFVLNELGDLVCERDEETGGSVVWISIKKKENENG